MRNNDAELIQQTLMGDQRAFGTLVRRYQKPLHALVWRKIGDFHIAEEITQDIFLNVYKKLQTLKNPNRFAGWLYVIASRRCIAWLKKKRIPMKSLDAMPPEELEELAYAQYHAERQDEVVSERHREVVKRLLQKLPESERTVVTLHYLGDMTCEDISKFLGVSPNTVKSRLHRARKRLKKEECMVRDVLGGFQLSASLVENVLREVAHIKPTAPTGGKPWMPWVVATSTTIFVILLMGSGTQYLARFQQPYSLNVRSETTVELVDTSLVRASKRKLDVRNQFGNTDVPDKNKGNTHLGTDARQIVADQSERSDTSVVKSPWIPMGGPEGTSGGRAGLFATSNRTLYAVAARGIYRLTENEDAWTLICESSPTRQFQAPMAERGDTLYVLTPDELLVSTDEGETWDTVGPRPEGRAFELLITDRAFYLVFEKHVFRSDDAGKSWIPMMQELHAHITKRNASPDISISDAVALDNSVFVGTNQGLYRVTTGVWERLPFYGPQFINSLIATEGKLYVVAGPDFFTQSAFTQDYQNLDFSVKILEFPPRIFRSTDLGDTWVDISPVEGKGTGGRLWMEVPPTDDGFRLQMFSGIQLAAVGEKLVVMGTRVLLHSSDSGDTWTNIGADRNALSQSILPVLALDENNFYTSDISGIARSMDAGVSWHPFSSGIVNSHVQSLITLENTLCALTPEGVVKSTDLGESWTSIGVDAHAIVVNEGKLQKKQAAPDLLSDAKIAKANGALYVSNSTSDGVGFYYLSVDRDVLMSVQEIPAFAEDTLEVEWGKKINNAPGDRELNRKGKAARPRIIEEYLTNGGFTITDETVFMEFRHKLFRWRKGEAEWFNTGIVDTTERAAGTNTSKGLTLATSQNVVYVGKRDGSLFQSLDGGENWKEITTDLPFSFAYFEDITFAGPTVYLVTDQGVMNSHDGVNWNALTDTEEHRVLITRVVVDGDKVYGVCSQGVYRIDTGTNTWIQMAPEIPYKITAFAVDRGIFYIGTRHRGVLRLHFDQSNN
ncbi:MAG: sigma-70 family RNA polymerase sigma factor [Candidatus Poribacteria bacterium]|nr:sigma-70 family RNA polymerase sigma factor [Candidatus Poribacteria bacterium]